MLTRKVHKPLIFSGMSLKLFSQDSHTQPHLPSSLTALLQGSAECFSGTGVELRALSKGTCLALHEVCNGKGKGLGQKMNLPQVQYLLN